MSLSTTVSVYCQADNNCTVSSSGNTDDNGPAVIFVGEVIKTVMKTWQLMVRMQEKMAGKKKKMIVIMLMTLRKRRR